MPNTQSAPDYAFLKPILGDELYAQVAEKLSAAKGVAIANIADGSYIAKASHDAELAARDKKVSDLTNDLASRDKTIASMNVTNRVVSQLRASGARNPEMTARLIDRAKIEEKDGELSGLGEQVEALKKSEPYLFEGAPGARGGLMGGEGCVKGGSVNQQINDAIRSTSSFAG